MRTSASSVLLSFVLVCACGGGAAETGAGEGGGAGGGAGSGGSGGEVAGESEGFDMEGFEDTEATGEHTGSAIATLGITPPPSPWESMSGEEREYYMAARVLPIAHEQFNSWAPGRFDDMSCATCHGDDAEAEHYEMPSRSLPRLPAMGTPEWTALSERPAYAFMNDTVTPTVRTQLGMDAYDPATGTGFGCYSCHPHD